MRGDARGRDLHAREALGRSQEARLQRGRQPPVDVAVQRLRVPANTAGRLLHLPVAGEPLEDDGQPLGVLLKQRVEHCHRAGDDALAAADCRLQAHEAHDLDAVGVDVSADVGGVGPGVGILAGAAVVHVVEDGAVLHGGNEPADAGADRPEDGRGRGSIEPAADGQASQHDEAPSGVELVDELLDAGLQAGQGKGIGGQIVDVAAGDRLDAAFEFVEVRLGEPIDPVVGVLEFVSSPHRRPCHRLSAHVPLTHLSQ